MLAVLNFRCFEGGSREIVLSAQAGKGALGSKQCKAGSPTQVQGLIPFPLLSKGRQARFCLRTPSHSFTPSRRGCHRSLFPPLFLGRRNKSEQRNYLHLYLSKPFNCLHSASSAVCEQVTLLQRARCAAAAKPEVVRHDTPLDEAALGFSALFSPIQERPSCSEDTAQLSQAST